MRRRDFISILGAASVAWPLAARAQQPGGRRRIGVLMLNREGDLEGQARASAFEQGLAELGWTVSRNLHLDYRWDVSDAERARVAATELLGLAPDLLLASSVSATRAAKRATASIPIVFTAVSEPMTLGIVSSLSHPGGNITGFTNLEPTVAAKWLELLKTIAPGIARVALMFNPGSTPATPLFQHSIEAAASKFKVEAISSPVHSAAEIETAITQLGSGLPCGLIVPPDTFMAVHRRIIIDLAARMRVPSIFAFRFFAVDAGLMSYGPDVTDQFRRAAGYADRILRGERVGELPVQQPTKFELVINMKTAKAFGLKVPPMLLAIADEVIE